MKVFIYERVSSEEQVKHGYSLDAQHDALTEFCTKHDHVILGEYRDEGISASGCGFILTIHYLRVMPS